MKPSVPLRKQKQRQKLSQDVDAFLARGGRVKQVASDHRGFGNEVIFLLKGSRYGHNQKPRNQHR